MRFEYSSRPARVRFERDGAPSAIAHTVTELDMHRMLLITSPREIPRARAISAAVQDTIVAEHTDVQQHVPASSAEAAVQAAVASDADGLLAIGGGSAIGTAKVIAHHLGLPIIAVPTTYSGSEMTATWGMTTDGRKVTAVDDKVAPRGVVYDPALLAGLPDSIAVPSAFNAMAHCVEALWVSRANPIIDLVALAGIRALREGLDLLHSENREGAEDRLLYGAFLGGMALGSVGSGLHHKICHALGGAFDTPHAETHTVILPWVIEFNTSAVPEIANDIALALDADDAAEGLRALYRRTGAPTTLVGIGLPAERLDDAVASVEARLPVDNPRPVDHIAIEWILKGAYGVG